MSTGTTSKGLTYPNGDDPVYMGDDAIKGLAIALDATYVQLIGSGTVTAATAPSDAKWPVGWSQVGPMSGGEATTGGWPTGGTLLTHKGTSAIANQLFFRNSGTRTTLWVRCGNGATWGPWAVLDSLGTPSAGVASGTATVTATGTPGNGSVGVTYPVGLFTAVPAVLLWAR